MTETKHKLDGLIERLEKATASDREIDRDIARLRENLRTEPFVGPSAWDMHKGMYWVIGSKDSKKGPVEEKWGTSAAHYTASIDAALTLVPPHSDVRIATCHEGVVGGHAWVSTLRNSHMSFPEIFGHFLSTPDDRKPLPIALCIAALKARAAIAKATG